MTDETGKEAREEVNNDTEETPFPRDVTVRRARGETAFWSKGKDKLVWME